MTDSCREAAGIEASAIEVTPEMAKAGAYALFHDGELFETANELAVMTRVFRAWSGGAIPWRKR